MANTHALKVSQQGMEKLLTFPFGKKIVTFSDKTDLCLATRYCSVLLG